MIDWIHTRAIKMQDTKIEMNYGKQWLYEKRIGQMWRKNILKKILRWIIYIDRESIKCENTKLPVWS